MKVIRC